MNANLQQCLRFMLTAACLLASNCLAQGNPAEVGSHKQRSPEKKAGFTEFEEHVRAYEKLRNDLRAGIPPVHKRDSPEGVQNHEQALAQKIVDARKNAKPGDIFTADARGAFGYEIRKVFAGKHGRSVRRTLAQGSPVQVELFVNKRYPDTIPVTTVPPTLLQHFPKLPKFMEYRVAGDNLVLEDTESRLVVDIFTGAFPNAPPQ